MKWTIFTWKFLWFFFVFINTQFATTWKVLTFFKYLEYNIFHGIHENRLSKWCFSIWKFFDCPDQLNFARVLVFEQRSFLVLINVFCIDGYSCLRYWNELFFSCVSGFRLKFSRIALWRKRLQLDSKSDLTTNGLILGFFVGKWLLWLTSYLYRLKFAKIALLFFFFDDINFFRCLVWGVFWSVL